MRGEKGDRLDPFDRLGRDLRAYESDLRAFGPDLLVETARRSGVAKVSADYASVAKALAHGLGRAGHER